MAVNVVRTWIPWSTEPERSPTSSLSVHRTTRQHSDKEPRFVIAVHSRFSSSRPRLFRLPQWGRGRVWPASGKTCRNPTVLSQDDGRGRLRATVSLADHFQEKIDAVAKLSFISKVEFASPVSRPPTPIGVLVGEAQPVRVGWTIADLGPFFHDRNALRHVGRWSSDGPSCETVPIGCRRVPPMQPKSTIPSRPSSMKMKLPG